MFIFFVCSDSCNYSHASTLTHYGNNPLFHPFHQIPLTHCLPKTFKVHMCKINGHIENKTVEQDSSRDDGGLSRQENGNGGAANRVRAGAEGNAGASSLATAGAETVMER
ncbi:hypothetical protein RIF29_16183 [Crotalaria pallida]|uniref:Uncharacterized protein n=1 Tax=Crotalaria pallida TaxID=3830 RepID=A0AAN9FGT2_CROPI